MWPHTSNWWVRSVGGGCADTLVGGARPAACWGLLETAAASLPSSLVVLWCALNGGACASVSHCAARLPPPSPALQKHTCTCQPTHDRRGSGLMRRCVVAGLCWCTATRARAAV